MKVNFRPPVEFVPGLSENKNWWSNREPRVTSLILTTSPQYFYIVFYSTEETMPPDREPQTHGMAFATAGGPGNCPVERCRGRAATRMAMGVHFLHQHVRDNVIIL